MASQVAFESRLASKVKQACDCCHARKIRCSGGQPCTNCRTTSLECSYLSIPKKKGPKGPSKRVPRAVQRMKLQQAHQTLPKAPSSSSSSSFSSSKNAPGSYIDSQHHIFEPSPLISEKLVDRYVDSFFKNKYPITPILHRHKFSASLAYLQTSPEIYSLVTSICAAIASQSQADQHSMGSPDNLPSDTVSADFFINEAKRARHFRDFDDKPTLEDVQTGFFLFAALFNLDRHNSAWFYLREAMTMLQLLNLHEEDTYQEMDEIDALFGRRTFWLLFITER